MIEFWVFIIAGALVIMNIILASVATSLQEIAANGEKSARELALIAEIANIKRG